MKVYVILESFTDYEHNTATSFGVFRTIEKAIENLPKAILDRFGYDTIEDWENDYGECFNDYMSLDGKRWIRSTDDTDHDFLIQADELED